MVFKKSDTCMLINTVYFIGLQEMSVESMTRYVSPINPAVFPHLTVVLTRNRHLLYGMVLRGILTLSVLLLV